MSVVVPAHNESALIRRLVSRLAVDDRLEVVVVANGCTDDTADVARGISSRVTVVEIDEASKIAALNAGDQVTTVWPRAYVDADVVVEPSALLAVGAALAGGALVCSPALRVATSGSSWAVRAYYRIWELTDYRRESHIGSGIYALSAEGRSRFTSFPPIIADDRFVQTRFAPSERVTLEEHHFEVEAPQDFRSLVHRQERIALGNLELRRREPDTDNVAISTAVPPVGRSADGTGMSALAGRVLVRPALWAPFVVYCTGYLLARMGARRRWRAGALQGWNRDESTRVAS